MAQEIKIFENPEFGKIRIHLNASNEPLFCLADLCSALGINNHRNVKNRLDEGDVHQVDTIDNLGRTQQVIFVTESGMYDVIIRSDAESAKPFRKWVTSEVLPSIRKTGGYQITPPTPALPTSYIEALKALVAAEEEKLQLQLANQSMQPKAVYFDNLVERNLLTNFRDTAKQIHIPQNKFIELLLENKYLYRDQKGNLKPYSDYTPKYFEMKDWERNGKAGTQVLVTPQGKEAFRLMWGGMSYEN